jgi:hypothetical protein
MPQTIFWPRTKIDSFCECLEFPPKILNFFPLPARWTIRQVARFCTGAFNFEAVCSIMGEQPFGHLAASGNSGWRKIETRSFIVFVPSNF